MPIDGKTRDKGEFDLGNWEIKPITGVIRVRVYVAHDCEGVKRATQIGEVML
jgi:hypothetical protein